jgi:ATP-dependent Clp protease ATP-binding subunit ClpC
MTGIPLTRMTTEDTLRLMQMEDELHKKVISQDEAIKAIAKAVRRSRSGLQDPKRPTGTFVFAGPTGVGKTLLAKTLAEFMFGDEDALVQVDMSEYQERHNISRLIGAPPGYVGYEEGGQLTEKIRRRPYSVVLLDEIEKAHPDVYNMLLQIMEEGHLTDSFGRKVDFKNAVLIMTTNVGAQSIASAGFGFIGREDAGASYESMKKNVLAEISRVFKPEFIGRLDEIVVFHKLGDEDMKHIVDIELSKVRERLRERGLRLELADDAKQFVIDKGRGEGDRDHKDYGARPLRRAIEMFVEDPLSEELLRGEFDGKNVIRISVKEVGGEKSLVLTGGYEEASPPEEPELAAVGAAEGDHGG